MNRIADALVLAFVIEMVYYEIPLFILLGDWASIAINMVLILFYWVINLKDNELLFRFAQKVDNHYAIKNEKKAKRP